MSAATRAKTAKDRAKIAAGFLYRGECSGRAFDDCFEMNDGDEVLAELLRMAKRGARLMEAIRRYQPQWLTAAVLALALAGCAHPAAPTCPDLSRGCHPTWELRGWYVTQDSTEGTNR